MRLHLIFMLILLLAACGSGDSQDTPSDNPTAVSPVQSDNQTDATPEVAEDGEIIVDTTLSFEELAQDVLGEDEPTQVFPTATLGSEGALPIPLPGTLVASETEEAEPFTGPFERIRFLQRGGSNDVTIRFEITSDGLVEREGQTGQVGQDVIQQLDQMIDDLNFMGLQGTFMGPAPNDDVYQYRITVIKGDTSRAIWSQDGFMPDQYRDFIALIRSAGDSVATEPEVAEPVVPGGS